MLTAIGRFPDTPPRQAILDWLKQTSSTEKSTPNQGMLI